ncbi:MAG: hypothetical protein IPJ87_01440 [Flavobacteriales bacterium]|nr:hypothetical protein [Flavobacteriales bacterium]
MRKTSLVRVPIRLGEDVFASGAIGAAKRDYLIKSLKAFRLPIDVRCASLPVLCDQRHAEASNSAETIARVEMETGVDIEAIGGREEGRPDLQHLLTQDLLKDRSYLFIDVGGGSTELTWLEKGRRAEDR